MPIDRQVCANCGHWAPLIVTSAKRPKQTSWIISTNLPPQVSNLGAAYRELIKNSKGRGRLVILFSDDAEFIYGDGIYSNISSTVHNLTDLRVVIPFTPNIAVIWATPMAYASKPHTMALAVDALTVLRINSATQVYSKDYLFYRSDKPEIIEAFALQEHRVFAERKNALFEFVNSLIEDHSDREYMFKWA
ncbi:MAG: hypothetical protein ACI9ES_003238 [Oceanospirillaceae bacterium]